MIFSSIYTEHTENNIIVFKRNNSKLNILLKSIFHIKNNTVDSLHVTTLVDYISMKDISFTTVTLIINHLYKQMTFLLENNIYISHLSYYDIIVIEDTFYF